MTRGALIIGLTLFLGAQVNTVRADGASRDSVQADGKPTVTCHLSSLSGNYIYAQDGFIVSGSEATQRTPFAQVGRENFDGAGKMSGIYTASLNGKTTSGHYSGTYTMNADCMGTVVFTDNFNQTFHFDVYSADGGEEFVFIQTDAGVVSSAFERRKTGLSFGR
jgi:hypothetical protein